MEFVKKSVEVAYAKPDSQHIVVVELKEAATIESVIYDSGILAIFPEIDLTKQAVGIFGKVKKLTDNVHAGDRVEIYRALLCDPKEIRRMRSKR